MNLDDLYIQQHLMCREVYFCTRLEVNWYDCCYHLIRVPYFYGVISNRKSLPTKRIYLQNWKMKSSASLVKLIQRPAKISMSQTKLPLQGLSFYHIYYVFHLIVKSEFFFLIESGVQSETPLPILPQFVLFSEFWAQLYPTPFARKVYYPYRKKIPLNITKICGHSCIRKLSVIYC